MCQTTIRALKSLAAELEAHANEWQIEDSYDSGVRAGLFWGAGRVRALAHELTGDPVQYEGGQLAFRERILADLAANA